MEHSIRKTPTLIYVTYSDGDYSNNLIGSNFTAEDSETKINLSIDLSFNYKSRNNAINSYDDIHDLAGKYKKLKWIQINEDQIIKGLSKVYEKNLNASWHLKLIFGNKIIEYEIKPTLSNRSLFLNIS